jgi:hypothetical protein
VRYAATCRSGASRAVVVNGGKEEATQSLIDEIQRDALDAKVSLADARRKVIALGG